MNINSLTHEQALDLLREARRVIIEDEFSWVKIDKLQALLEVPDSEMEEGS